MIITNKLNLPEPFQSLVKNEIKEFNEKRYSVTELLLPTREIVLRRKYNSVLSEDVSDLIPALLGTAFHKMIEEIDNSNNTEVKLEINLSDGYVLSGRVDKMTDEDIIDYKTCKVKKIIDEKFEDDYHQGMIYAYMRLIKHDVKSRRLRFFNLMKDWSKVNSFKNNYPSSPIYEWIYKINDSDYDYIEKFIKHKFIDIIRAQKELPGCSEKEKWYTGTKYAVYKKAGDKRAAIVCDTEQEAHDYITNKCDGVGQIEVRKGQNLKCDYYCSCSKFCKGENY